MEIIGAQKADRFSKKHPRARKPLQRFLDMARASSWQHLSDVKNSFPATDYAPKSGLTIFDIGGNKYRLVARIGFAEQLLAIQAILTHEEYDRETF